MQIYTCRDPNNTLRLCKGAGRWQDLQPDGSIRDLTVIPRGKTDHALILVHGFNTSMNTLRVAYTQLGVNIASVAGKTLDVFGFSWPSQERAWHYLTAFHNCTPVAPHLLAMIRGLRAIGYNKVSVFCHSMGSIVTMRMVEMAEAGEVYRIVIEQGDAYAESFQIGERYGTNCASKLHGLFSYYSTGDEVLGFWARVFGARPGMRVGFVPFSGDVPPLYKSFDAQKIHGSEVDHGTFLTSIPLITHAVQRLSGAL